MFAKVNLKEPNTHPLFRYLQSEQPHRAQWNFHKWLIDANGNLVGRHVVCRMPRM
jgi:glutathione peroxidase